MSRRRQFSVETLKAHAAEDVLKVALAELGWRNVRAASGASKSVCDIYWRGLDHGDQTVPEGSYVARIPGMSGVAHKAELAKHLNRLRHFFPEEFNFYPRTWLLPEEQEDFEAYAQQQRERGKTVTYIVKPDEGSQGEGIFLIQNPRDLYHLKLPSVVQEYIPKPLLLRGLKFDLRLYILVAGTDPLEVYLSRSGMARFCTVPYQPPTLKNLHQTFMHLTNYSLNKRSKEYVHSSESDKGSKQTLASVVSELEAQGCDTEEMWGRVGLLVCRTLVAVLPQLMVERKAFMAENSLTNSLKCFQILGFDILLDEKLRPFLLEVNAHPSLRVDFEQPVRPGVVEYVPSPVDLAIKLPVVRDTLTIIGRKIRQGEVTLGSFEELTPSGLEHLRVFERAAQLFMHFVGVRGGLKLGASAFRTFTRQCRLCGDNFTNADVDILYIEVSRRHGSTLERNALTFHGFCHALLALAKRLYGEGSVGALTRLLDNCEPALHGHRK